MCYQGSYQDSFTNLGRRRPPKTLAVGTAQPRPREEARKQVMAGTPSAGICAPFSAEWRPRFWGLKKGNLGSEKHCPAPSTLWFGATASNGCCVHGIWHTLQTDRELCSFEEPLILQFSLETPQENCKGLILTLKALKAGELTTGSLWNY